MKATLLRNNGLLILIDEDGKQRLKPVSSESEVIKLATSMGLTLVNEQSPKHQDFINKYKGLV